MSSKHGYLLTHFASDDLREIVSYLAAEAGEAIAARIEDELFACFERLATQARHGPSSIRPHAAPGVLLSSLSIPDRLSAKYIADSDSCNPAQCPRCEANSENPYFQIVRFGGRCFTHWSVAAPSASSSFFFRSTPHR